MHRVLIVEDNAETRRSIEANVERHPKLAVVGAVGTVAEALEALQTPPDVLLVDLGLPDGSGTDVIRHAATLNPQPEIMVITVFGDERHIVGAIEAGATGYLLKDADSSAIADAILQLVDGGSPITPVIARHMLKRFQTGAADERQPVPDAPHLTPRETEVLRLVSRGYSNNEIAELLEMSFHTVTSHVKHIYRKLSVRSRSEAVFEAAQLGIIDIHG